MQDNLNPKAVFVTRICMYVPVLVACLVVSVAIVFGMVLLMHAQSKF